MVPALVRTRPCIIVYRDVRVPKLQRYPPLHDSSPHQMLPQTLDAMQMYLSHYCNGHDGPLFDAFKMLMRLAERPPTRIRPLNSLHLPVNVKVNDGGTFSMLQNGIN